MANIEELKVNHPKRESVRGLLFEVTRGATNNVSYEQLEKLINGIIDVAVREAVEQCLRSDTATPSDNEAALRK